MEINKLYIRIQDTGDSPSILYIVSKGNLPDRIIQIRVSFRQQKEILEIEKTEISLSMI